MTLNQIKHFAICKHESNNQRYGNASYSLHLQLVEMTARKYLVYIEPKSRLNVLAACWAHDLLEDTDISFEELAEISNPHIANIVYCVSNEQAINREERNCKTFSKTATNPLAVYVKCCDRLVNGRFSQINKPELFKKYKADYPVFKFMLRQSGPYPKLWNALDELFYPFSGYDHMPKRSIFPVIHPESLAMKDVNDYFKINI